MLKVEIHKKIFGDKSQGNELTKIFILELHNAKRMKILDWEIICINLFKKTEELDQKYLNSVENKYYCSAYNCLCNLIRKTQTKDDIFVKFLFQTFRDKK
jgi:hypothetical protein